MDPCNSTTLRKAAFALTEQSRLRCGNRIMTVVASRKIEVEKAEVSKSHNGHRSKFTLITNGLFQRSWTAFRIADSRVDRKRVLPLSKGD